MTVKHTLAYSLLISILFILSISCGSGSGAEVASTEAQHKIGYRLKADVLPGDQLLAYSLDGSLLEPGEVVSETTPDTLSGEAELQLSGDQSYRIRLKRSNIEFLETIILKDQFSLASGNTLDIGEMSASSTLMTWAAFKTQSLIPVLTKEKALLLGLEDLQKKGSSIKVLSDIKTDNINEDVFGKQLVHQINLLTVLIARLSYRLDQGDLSPSIWEPMIEKMVELFTHFNQAKLASEASNLIQDYRNMIVDSSELPKIVSSDIATLYVKNSDISLDDFIEQSQSSDLNVLNNLFKLFEK